MSVLIKNMNMPENCFRCDIHKSCSHAWYLETTHRPDDCPLGDIPAPHGRLIDENDVIDAIHERLKELQTHPEFKKKHGDIDLIGVMPYIAKIKPVIEAEEE